MRFAEAVSVLQNCTDDLALSPLSAQTSKVRGFGRHGVGGANPADPRGLPTLIGTWSALHHLQQNRHAPSPPLPPPNPLCTITQMGLQQWKISPCQPLVYFSLARWLLIISLFNCGGGPGPSVCGGTPPGARRGVNVMLSLMGSGLQRQPVPQHPLSAAWRQALEGHYQAIPLRRVMCKPLLAGGRKLASVCLTRLLLPLSLGSWQCPCGGGSDWWCPHCLTHYGNPAADGDVQMRALMQSYRDPGVQEVSFGTGCQSAAHHVWIAVYFT